MRLEPHAHQMPMKRPLIGLLALALCSTASTTNGISPPELVKESGAGPSELMPPCLLAPSRNGTCANYRWYNVCSGYIWVYQLGIGEAVGVQFGGPEEPCVAPGNVVKRAITYYRNTFQMYYASVDVFLDRDDDGDGCPDSVLAMDLCMDPGLRWNCSNFNVSIPTGLSHLIVRQSRRGCPYDWGAREDRFATDGPYSQACDPVGTPRSFYYGVNISACVPWVGPTGRHDNFLTWLIVDTGTTATETTTWGSVKGLYR
jgi:hypothetical protein